MKRWMILLVAVLALLVVTAVAASATDLPVSENPISNITVKLADDGRNYTIRWDDVSGAFYTVQMLDSKTNQWVTVREKMMSARVSPDYTTSDLDVSCTAGSDQATTAQWTAVPGATGYEVRNEASPNTNEWIGKVRVSGASAVLRLPPNSEQHIRVSVLGNVQFRIYALNSAGTSCLAYQEYTAQNVYITSCDYSYRTPAAPAFSSGASAGVKEAYALMLTQAVNNTRMETGKVNLSAVMEQTSSAAAMGQNENTHSKKTITCTYTNGSGQATVTTEENGKADVTSTSFSMLQTILVPVEGETFLFDQHNLSTFQKYVSDVSASTSGGQTVVTITLKPETVTTSTGLVYHPGLVGTVITPDNLQSLVSESANTRNVTGTVGASTIKATINSNYKLDALDISNPYTMSMSMSLTTVNVTTQLTYSYTFTRTDGPCDTNGHEWGAWTVFKPAITCSDTEEQRRTCTRCGSFESRYFPSTVAHTLDPWVVVQPATCKDAGLQVQRCAVCNRIISQEVIQPGAHTLSDWMVAQVPTCTEAGLRYRTCTVCGQRLQEVAIPAAGHTFTDWKSYLPADSSEKAMDLRFCTVCGLCETRESSTENPVPTDPTDETPEEPNPNACKYCGQVHTGLFGWLIKFFHSILAIFKR